MTEDLYISTKASISNWIFSIAKCLKHPTEIFDFDSTAEEEQLEQMDLMGPIEFAVAGSQTLGEVMFKVAVCTHNDPQIQRLERAINEIINHCNGKCVTIPILHYETGLPMGMMKSDGEWLASPVVRLQSRTRPFQTVSLVFNLTLTF